MILVLDTSAENVFIGLWDDGKSIWHAQESFPGGRELNGLIIKKLDKVLSYSQEYESTFRGIIIAAGPGSFTGLRIGMSVANTLAYTQNIPIVAPKEIESTADLLHEGLDMLKSAGSQFGVAATPYYGTEPHITQSKKR